MYASKKTLSVVATAGILVLAIVLVSRASNISLMDSFAAKKRQRPTPTSNSAPPSWFVFKTNHGNNTVYYGQWVLFKMGVTTLVYVKCVQSWDGKTVTLGDNSMNYVKLGPLENVGDYTLTCTGPFDRFGKLRRDLPPANFSKTITLTWHSLDVGISASPNPIARGTETKLYLEVTGAASCTRSGGTEKWRQGTYDQYQDNRTNPDTFGPYSFRHHYHIDGLTQDTVFSTSCTGPDGAVTNASLTATVVPPDVQITAPERPIGRNQQTTVEVAATAVKECTLTDGTATWRARGYANTTVKVDKVTNRTTYTIGGLQETTTFSVHCTGYDGSAVEKSATIVVLPFQVVGPVPGTPYYDSMVCPETLYTDGVRCMARILTDAQGTPIDVGPPKLAMSNKKSHFDRLLGWIGLKTAAAIDTDITGLGPSDLHRVYAPGIVRSVDSDLVIAIVMDFDHPSIFDNLDTYSKAYGIESLPKCESTVKLSTKPCFEVVKMPGVIAPPLDSYYGKQFIASEVEVNMDVQMAHAMCQNCRILLVEIPEMRAEKIMNGIQEAINRGADVISLSLSGHPSGWPSTSENVLNHPGIAIVAAAGDSGYKPGGRYPAISQFVTAVGGTTLQLDSTGNYVGERAWYYGTSGCATGIPKPAWQKDVNSGCSARTTADISAVADLNNGALVFVGESALSLGHSGWVKGGGTSLATPIIAGMYGLAGRNAFAGKYAPQVLWEKYPRDPQYPTSEEIERYHANFRDITTGNNGAGACPDNSDGSPGKLCNAGCNYDGPTGLGSPKGLGAFKPR